MMYVNNGQECTCTPPFILQHQFLQLRLIATIFQARLAACCGVEQSLKHSSTISLTGQGDVLKGYLSAAAY